MSVRGDEVNWMGVELDRNRIRTDISVNWTELWTRLECIDISSFKNSPKL